MSRRFSNEWLIQVKNGEIPGHRLVYKFGRNSAVGTSPVPISIGGVYATPTSNTSLEIVSDDVADDIAGVGAKKVMVFGLVLTGDLFVSQTEEVDMDGTTPVALAHDYIRVFRAYVSESGTYASPTTVSQVGTITIQETGAGAVWLQIDELVAGNGLGQSQTALYTTESETTSILLAATFSVDSSKVAKIILFQRPNADDVTIPFAGVRRIVHQWDGIDAPDGSTFWMPMSKIVGAADIGFMASVSVGTGSISAEFYLLEMDN